MAMHGLMTDANPYQLQATAGILKSVVWLYVGPDQILPLTSALGAIIGVLLMFWHRVMGWVRRGWQFCAAKVRVLLNRRP